MESDLTVFVALIGAVGALFGALTGGFLSLVGVRFSLRGQFRHQQETWRYNRRRSILIEPVLRWIDSLAELMSETYWDAADLWVAGQRWDEKMIPASLGTRLKAFRDQELMMEGRLSAIGDEDLQCQFGELDSILFKFRGYIAECKVLSEARNQYMAARAVTGRIYERLATPDY